MDEIRLYDTLTRETLLLHAADGETFRFYCCGPTVYGPAHIGNFRAFVVQDVLRRTLEVAGYKTKHVRNLTDLDDKTIRDSQAAGESLKAFTDGWTKKFHADCDALNLLAPHVEPSAVEHIPHQIAMIQTLIERDHAYQGADGSVYFKVDSYEQYGRLTRLDTRELRTGAGETANDADEYEKDSVADFALWKSRKEGDGENFWDSPWGEGRPGWHLECSAMSLEYLGASFDLHAGGVDLCFPHHENEIAQSCCSTDGEFARHWFHNAHLMVDGKKMAKSEGTMYTLGDLEKLGYTAAELRFVLIGVSYGKPLNFIKGGKDAKSGLQSLDAARDALMSLSVWAESMGCADPQALPDLLADKSAGTGSPGPFAKAWEILRYDLNSQGAIGAIFGTIKKVRSTNTSDTEKQDALSGLAFLLSALGVRLPSIPAEEDVQVPDEIQALADERWKARSDKDWARSDELRDQLLGLGWTVLDGKDGYRLETC